jgi:CRISPR-associated endonuclease Csn1
MFDTEVVIELARELNDNNKRIAIERYQNERKNNREKYREFLKEFSVRENRNFNIEESLATFELWTEQTFAETIDEAGNKVINKDHREILREKEALKRYELWIEQKGQCIYTGKTISIAKLFSSEIDIMHTIPRSLLPDNTMANITVGFAVYNRDLQQQKLPKQCENYSKDISNWGTAIEPRLGKWKE